MPTNSEAQFPVRPRVLRGALFLAILFHALRGIWGQGIWGRSFISHYNARKRAN